MASKIHMNVGGRGMKEKEMVLWGYLPGIGKGLYVQES